MKQTLALSLLSMLLLFSCNGEKETQSIVTSVTLNQSELNLAIGDNELLIASIIPGNAPNKAHVWSSTATQIASVNETGLVTAISTGDATISVRTLDGNKMAICNVTVVDQLINVTGVTINTKDTIILEGEKITLSTTIIPNNATNKQVIWSSSNIASITVDNNGIVEGKQEGNALIIAKTKDGEKRDTCRVEVLKKGILISKPEVSEINSTSALITGTVKALGIKTQELGICFSTSQSPTINDEKIVSHNESINSILRNLEVNTTYYVRLYATVDGKVNYGEQATFTSKGCAEISSPSIVSVSSGSVHIQGSVKTFGLQHSEVGICYSTNKNSTTNDNKVIINRENFEYTLYELTPETDYFIRIYTVINGITYYGEEIEFKTSAIIKTAFTPVDVYENKLILTSPIGYGIKGVNVCYGKLPNPQITDNITKAILLPNGKLQLTLTNLNTASTYYIRSYTMQGANVIYNNDEVSAGTIGAEGISFTQSYSKYEVVTETYPVTTERYWIYSKIEYNILPKGTYLVKGGYIMKTGDYVSSFYIENGKGTINCKEFFGWLEYSGANTYVKRDTPSVISFTNIETNVNYYLELQDIYWLRTY